LSDQGLSDQGLSDQGLSDQGLSDQDLQDGFQLTGLFLLRHVLEPRGQNHSDARDGFINAVIRKRAKVGSALS
jgi:DNA repair protein RecO (recombination protein O)